MGGVLGRIKEGIEEAEGSQSVNIILFPAERGGREANRIEVAIPWALHHRPIQDALPYSKQMPQRIGRNDSNSQTIQCELRGCKVTLTHLGDPVNGPPHAPPLSCWSTFLATYCASLD